MPKFGASIRNGFEREPQGPEVHANRVNFGETFTRSSKDSGAKSRAVSKLLAAKICTVCGGDTGQTHTCPPYLQLTKRNGGDFTLDLAKVRCQEDCKKDGFPLSKYLCSCNRAKPTFESVNPKASVNTTRVIRLLHRGSTNPAHDTVRVVWEDLTTVVDTDGDI